MKIKNSIFTSCLALALAGSAYAGTFTTLDWTGDSSLSFINPALATHSAEFGTSGASAVTVNGFTFEKVVINGGFSNTPSPINGTNFTITATATNPQTSGDALSSTGGGTDPLSTALRTGLMFNTGSTVTYSLTGLTAGYNYSFYFFNAGWTSATARTGSLDGSDDGVGNTFALNQELAAGNIIRYDYNTGAGTTFDLTVNNTGGLHQYAFVNIVPEPSTALLGGLGLLALLRRRR